MQTPARAGEQHTGRGGADAQPLPNLLGGHLLEAGQAENLACLRGSWPTALVNDRRVHSPQRNRTGLAPG